MWGDLYENIGGKIKSLAKWMFIVEEIGSIIFGFICLLIWGFEAWWALLIIVFGPVVAWVSSWILYAFGELVEDIHAMKNNYYPSNEEKAKLDAEAKECSEAEEKAKLDAEKEALCKKLMYALQFQTNEGMITYLKHIKDESIQSILKCPTNMVRNQIQDLLNKLQ